MNTEDLEKAIAALESRQDALKALSGYPHRTYRVHSWGTDSDKVPQEGEIGSRDVPVVPELGDVISSELVNGSGQLTGTHTIVLDVDYRMAIRETSPGHGHLFIDVPPMSEREYFDLLEALAKARVISRGYWLASVARKGSHVRTPWTPKERLEQVNDAVQGDPALAPDYDRVQAAVQAEYERATARVIIGRDPLVFRDADGVEWVEVETPAVGDRADGLAWKVDYSKPERKGLVREVCSDSDGVLYVRLDSIMAVPQLAENYVFYRRVEGSDAAQEKEVIPLYRRTADGVERVKVEEPQTGDYAHGLPWKINPASSYGNGVVTAVWPADDEGVVRVQLGSLSPMLPASDYAFYREVEG